MLLIYTAQITPRLTYICNFIFRDILGVQYKLTDNEAEFSNHEGPAINYSAKKLGNRLIITPTNLLFEKKIKEQEIFVTQWDTIKIFFQTNDHSSIPFDIFAASFFLVSRYEEYLPFSSDEHGRFEAKQSLAYTSSFLQEPIVDQWAYMLGDIIGRHFPEFEYSSRTFQYIPTIDVDNAYAFLFKGISRTLGATLRSIFNLNIQDNIRRYQTLAGKKDPYDTYDIFFDTHQKYGLTPIWFFLVGNSGKFDNNVSIDKTAYRKLIKNISERSEIGIHPSYKAFRDPDLLQWEVEELKQIINKEVIRSRQHYLRIHFNETYRNLINAGIQEDYTMGYSTDIGFRAGTCTPFHYYDLDNEEETSLTVYPFQVMDITLNQHKKYNVTAAISVIEDLIEKIKHVNGTFITIWHNEALSDHGHWKGWETVYREMLRLVFEK
ncbi:MAG: polysaccharide deacetylase family protein [Bacteroidales bacterium]